MSAARKGDLYRHGGTGSTRSTLSNSEKHRQPLVILGLDPGSLHTGYGLLEKRGSQLLSLAEGRFSCSAAEPVASRLAFMAAELESVLDRFQPQVAALESLFHGLNPRSLIVLAQARGALLAHLAGRGVPIREYTPAEVKRAITGNGRADKRQVARMVRMLLSLRRDDLPSDATDALAVAICYAHRYQMDRIASQQ